MRSIPLLGEVRQAMAECAAAFEPRLMSPADAAVAVRAAAAVEHMAAAVKALAAARSALETGVRLSALPALDAAARKGDLSPAQAAPIAAAAAKDPTAEARLVAKAKTPSCVAGPSTARCARSPASVPSPSRPCGP